MSRTALVFRLTQSFANRNILDDYSGLCAKRPESGNCEKTPIERINTVGPSCAGNLNIEFRGVHSPGGRMSRREVREKPAADHVPAPLAPCSLRGVS